MADSDEILRAVQRLCEAFQSREGEFDSANMYYKFETPPRSSEHDRELWLDVAAVMVERPTVVEAVSKLELLRGRVTADRIELFSSLVARLSNSLGEQIRSLRQNMELQPASQAIIATLDQQRAAATSDAAQALMHRIARPDESLQRIRAAVESLRSIETRFDEFVNTLQGATHAMMKEIVRLRNDLHDVDVTVKASSKKSDKFGWWGITIGVLGLLAAFFGIWTTLR